jgi:hypothetical protein
LALQVRQLDRTRYATAAPTKTITMASCQFMLKRLGIPRVRFGVVAVQRWSAAPASTPAMASRRSRCDPAAPKSRTVHPTQGRAALTRGRCNKR